MWKIHHQYGPDMKSTGETDHKTSPENGKTPAKLQQKKFI